MPVCTLKVGDRVLLEAGVGCVNEIGAVDNYGLRFAKGNCDGQIFYIQDYQGQVKVKRIIA